RGAGTAGTNKCGQAAWRWTSRRSHPTLRKASSFDDLRIIIVTQMFRHLHWYVYVALVWFGAQPRGVAAQPAGHPDGINIIPRPVSVVAGTGHFTLTSRTTIWTDRTSR